MLVISGWGALTLLLPPSLPRSKPSFPPYTPAPLPRSTPVVTALLPRRYRVLHPILPPYTPVVAAFSPVITAKAGIQKARAGTPIPRALAGLVRIRICGIIGFSGFLPHARLRPASAHPYSSWRDFLLQRTPQSARKRNPVNPANPVNPDSDNHAPPPAESPRFLRHWIPAFAGMTAYRCGLRFSHFQRKSEFLGDAGLANQVSHPKSSTN